MTQQEHYIFICVTINIYFLSQCLWCKKGNVTDADLIMCFGCEKSFHGACCSLNKSSVKIIKEVSGVKWYCLHCDNATFAGMISQRFNKIEEKVDSLSNDNSETKYDELLKRIDHMTSEVANIKSLVDLTLPLTGTQADPVEDEDVFRSRKRLRSGRRKESTVSTPWPMLPIGVSIQGTDNTSTLKVIEPKLWYHVSRFDPKTTAEDLKEYVSGKINSSEVECYSLLPKGRASEDLRFISFKIGVLNSNKAAVTDPSIWPSNVTVRPREGFSKFPRINRPHLE